FLALAVGAIVSVVAAAVVYTSSTGWSTVAQHGVPLFPNLRSGKPDIEVVAIASGDKTLTLENHDQKWTAKERSGYPVQADKVRELIRGLSEAELVEAKTRNKQRYALIGLEDPTDKDASSKLLRLIDGKGNIVAEVIVGNTRQDAFGEGKVGTYIRKPGDEQTWLVNTDIEPSVELADWVDPSLFQAPQDQVVHLDVTVPGEDVLNIQPSQDKRRFGLANMPEGMKLKYDNALDDIVEAATDISFDDVKKVDGPLSGDKVGTAVLQLSNGLKVSMAIEPGEHDAWLTLEASGEGEAKKTADELNARAKGWAFHIPASKAKSILVHREEFLEKVAS
ncbi:MAG TPA: DUF4340 domain-containing protein, partial [Fimbriimonadaceae bacterium]|nr:DUF4340 domain-containing protein [Fimbriimonadaceae bacterium]